MRSFITYLLQRFQLLPLSLLVISDVLVILRVGAIDEQPFFHGAAIFLFVLAYLFNNRVGDDIRDFEFDAEHYPDRDLQRGTLQLSQLKVIALFCVIVMVLIGVTLSSTALWLVLPVISIGWLARRDFFLPHWFKNRHFFAYNFINMLQMLVLQVFVYMAVLDTLVLDPIMYWHVALVFGLSIQIEVGRKIKPDRSSGMDLYSDRLGMQGATWLWFGVGVFCVLLSALLAMEIGVANGLILGASVAWCLILSAGGWWYTSRKNASAEALFWLSMILVYVGQNLVLAYG